MRYIYIQSRFKQEKYFFKFKFTKVICLPPQIYFDWGMMGVGEMQYKANTTSWN